MKHLKNPEKPTVSDEIENSTQMLELRISGFDLLACSFLTNSLQLQKMKFG